MTKIKPLPRCSAYCTAEKYLLADMTSNFSEQGDRTKYFTISDVLHRVHTESQGDIFYFSYGAVVMWGLNQEQESNLIKEAQLFARGRLKKPESELSRYSFGKPAKILKDDIILPEDSMLTKMAFSHGLAQSVKLSVFEKLIDRRIESSRYAPISLAQKGRIPLSRKKLAKMMGTIILDRSSINLHTDILDTPEFFWEHSDLEPLYRLISQDLDIAARVEVLNKRLNILGDLFEVLKNELETKHSAFLEWIIIILISIEVIITLAKDIFHIL